MKVELSCWCMILLKAFLWVVMMYIDSLIKTLYYFYEKCLQLNKWIFKQITRKVKFMKPKVAFICVHNSCRSQISEALGKHLASDVFESYSAGTEIKTQINQNAVRLMKILYGIDMQTTQYCKTINEIPVPDIAISMGCDVGCPHIGKKFDDNWALDDPTGHDDETFKRIILEIEKKVFMLKEQIQKRNNF